MLALGKYSCFIYLLHVTYSSVLIFSDLCDSFFQAEQSKHCISGFTLPFLTGEGTIAYITTSVGALEIRTVELYFWFGSLSSFQTIVSFMIAIELVSH